MTAESFEWGNPERVLEIKQERELKEKAKSGRLSCDGCQFKARTWGVEYCIKDHAKAGRANMVRCKHFKGVTNV